MTHLISSSLLLVDGGMFVEPPTDCRRTGSHVQELDGQGRAATHGWASLQYLWKLTGFLQAPRVGVVPKTDSCDAASEVPFTQRPHLQRWASPSAFVDLSTLVSAPTRKLKAAQDRQSTARKLIPCRWSLNVVAAVHGSA